MTNNKNNPYTLRFDIYQQAQNRLMDKFYQDHALWQDWTRTDSEYEGPCPLSERPEFPSHDNILEEAQKIYDFVQTQ